MSQTTEKTGAGAWSPLTIPLFRWVWLATVVSNIGVWFQEVAAGWLMTSLNPSPFLVALVQAANTLPLLVLGLPAGVLADLFDRRKLLIGTTIWMTIMAAVLALFQWYEILTATGLLLLVASVAIGTALSAPAWQAVVPELVPRSHLAPAIALNSLGINISRAIGPALAGVVLSTMGPAVAFACNAVSFLGVLVVLLLWKRDVKQDDLPAEQFHWAMMSGIRYVRFAPAFRAVLVRSFLFASFAVVLWALLPLVTRELLGGSAGQYGILLAAIGVGAVGGAILLPKIRKSLGSERLTLLAGTAYAAVVIGLALQPPFWVAAVLMLPAGFAWIAMLSTLHVSAQILLPGWVRARGLSVSLMVFFGSMALGSMFWGAVGAQIGLSNTLIVAAIGLLLGQSAMLMYKLPQGQGPNLTPSRHWPAPPAEVQEAAEGGGHVLVQIHYQIDPADEAAFLKASLEMRAFRQRSGAFGWRLYRDPDHPNAYIESFMNRDWTDHLRLHERVTESDRVIQERFQQYHRGNEKPKVVHLVDAQPGRG